MGKTLKRDLDQLQDFLRTEMAAVRIYERFIQSLGESGRPVPSLLKVLRSLRQSHHNRADWIRERIRALGGNTEDAPPSLDVEAFRVRPNAADSTVLSALASGESLGKELYEAGLVNLTPLNRNFVEQTVLPEQRRSFRTAEQLSALSA